MKFMPLDEFSEVYDRLQLKSDAKTARQIGSVRLGQFCLYISKTFKTYFIPYTKITRAYRRVLLVPAQMCCASGDLPVDSIVIHSEKGEVANVTLPGAKAAQILLDELKLKAPDVIFTCPEKTKEYKPGKSEKSKQAHKSKDRNNEVG